MATLSGRLELILSGNLELILSGNLELILSGNLKLILSGNLELILSGNLELILSGNLELILSGNLELILLYPMVQSEQTFPPSTQLAVLAMPRHDRACFIFAVPQTSQTTSCCSRRPRVRNS